MQITSVVRKIYIRVVLIGVSFYTYPQKWIGYVFLSCAKFYLL